MSEQASPDTGISIYDIDAPTYVRNLVLLDAHGQSPEDARATVVSFNDHGEVASRRSALRIPLREIIYPNQEAVDNAILHAMGYDPAEQPAMDEKI
jgi:hypothetical protein